MLLLVALAHLYRGVFPFCIIWSLYPAVFGQATPSAFGRVRLALTFYEGRNNEGIYKFFREEYSVYGCIFKPTGVGKNKDSIALTSRYDFIWQDLIDGRKYYIIEI